MQVAHAVGAVLLVEVDDHLGVALRGERWPRALQLRAQLAVVVDLAVQDDDDRAVLVEDRLVAGLEVDDAQALDAEARAPAMMEPARVRAAVLEPRAHAREQLRVDRLAVGADLSDDSAHSAEKRSDGPISRAAMDAVTFFINDSVGSR